jgi:hypothetical protein
MRFNARICVVQYILQTLFIFIVLYYFMVKYCCDNMGGMHKSKAVTLAYKYCSHCVPKVFYTWQYILPNNIRFHGMPRIRN